MIRRAEFWSGLFWLAVGSFVCWQALELGLGSLREPGSGFVFFWTGLMICTFAISVAFSGIRGRGPMLGDPWQGTRWRNVLLVIVALVAYALLFEHLGFVVCSLALLLFLMVVVDPVPLRLAIPIALIAAVGIWYVLEKVLLVQLPKGSWLEDLPLF